VSLEGIHMSLPEAVLSRRRPAAGFDRQRDYFAQTPTDVSVTLGERPPRRR
jgi:hypothetical protein